jgi:predicted ferric reductase
VQAIDLCVRLYHTFSRKTGTLVIADNITTLTAAVETKRRYRGGEYFFVQVEEVSMLEWHPFSLAATTDNSLVFHILANQPGSWTERLQHVGPGVKVHLDGPYGCISLNTFSYQNIVYIAGGIGITALLNSIDNAINNYDGKPSAISTVSLHWSVRGSSVFNLVKDKIASLGVASQDTCKVRFELHIYDSSAANEELFGGLYLVSKGRMDVNIVIQNALSTVSSSKVCVLACGPHGLAQESVNVAQRLGIDVHKETFGY